MPTALVVPAFLPKSPTRGTPGKWLEALKSRGGILEWFSAEHLGLQAAPPPPPLQAKEAKDSGGQHVLLFSYQVWDGFYTLSLCCCCRFWQCDSNGK